MRNLQTKKLCLRLFFIASLSTILIACGKKETASEDPAQTLHMTIGAEPQSLDPHMVAGAVAKNILAGLVEPLARLDISNYQPAPAAATHWDISEDGLRYTFHLRKEAKWSDGQPVIADDFLFAWERILSANIGHYYAQDYFAIEGAEAFYKGENTSFKSVGITAIDEHTLEFTLTKFDPLFLKRLADESTAPVQPKTILAFGSIDDPVSKWTRPPNFISNGPYKLTKWEMNKIIVLEKNPHYWNAKNIKLEKIIAYTVEDTATEERMFRAGQVQLTFGGRIAATKIETYQKKSPELIFITPLYGTYYYIFNTQKPPFDDVNVRRAFAHSIDRDRVANKVAKSDQPPTNSISPTTDSYQPTSPIVFNPEQAKLFLANSSYKSASALPPFELAYNTNESHKKIAVAIQQMWKTSLDVSVPIQNMEWKIFLEARKSHAYTLARAGSISTFLDPLDFLQSYTTGHGMNDPQWSDEIFDELINQALSEKNLSQRLKILEKAEERLLDQAVIVPLFNYTAQYLKAPEVKNISFNAIGRPNFEDIYIEPSASN